MKRLINIAIILSVIITARAQKTELSALIDTNSIMIGDQATYTITVKSPTGSEIIWPAIKDTLSENIEIISQSPIDTAKSEDGFFRLEQRIIITSFDSGYYVLPPLSFLVKEAGDKEYQPMETEAGIIEVLNPDIDMDADIRDIKPPLEARLSFMEILPWLLAALGLGGLILLIIYIIKKKKRKEPIISRRKKPLLPPGVEALEALVRLKKKKLWQNGMTKAYYTELTYILRNYLERRFSVMANEMVTFEIMEALGGINETHEYHELLKEILNTADMVKFAKAKPLPDANERSIKNTEAFIRGTRADNTIDKEGQALSDKAPAGLEIKKDETNNTMSTKDEEESR